ncbi:MAG: hypothetical protein DLM68_07125 [Hyphomicrobiales bacterium]|nr:MAG: hypothetical protein DLM68_07125 [Hyphomicrobiales bacterium]
MDVRHFAGPGGLGKTRKPSLFSAKVMFSRLRPPLGLRFSALRPPWSQAICARFTVLSDTRNHNQQPLAIPNKPA